MEIKVISKKISLDSLKKTADQQFAGELVKAVVDTDKETSRSARCTPMRKFVY